MNLGIRVQEKLPKLSEDPRETLSEAPANLALPPQHLQGSGHNLMCTVQQSRHYLFCMIHIHFISNTGHQTEVQTIPWNEPYTFLSPPKDVGVFKRNRMHFDESCAIAQASIPNIRNLSDVPGQD